VRRTFLRDATNLELSEQDLSVRAVQVRVEASTRPQLEYALALVEGPDSGKGGPQMHDERFGALLQRLDKRVGIGQCQSNGGAQS
jgi:hypothetical protein